MAALWNAPRTVIILAGLLCCGWPATAARSGEPDGSAVPAPRDTVRSLETRLRNGLQARLPRENRFVTDVVTSVHAGRLPQKVVDSTYHWAVNRGHRHPFAAFEKAVRIQAARLGIDLQR